MTTLQVQVRIPEEMVKIIDRWVAEGKFASRSNAINTIVAMHEERERIRAFYQFLVQRSKEARDKPDQLLPLEEIQ